MPAGKGLKREQREKLFEKLKEDREFRELMKKDWRAALGKLNLKADDVVGGILKREEIEEFKRQAAGWTIEVVISAKAVNDERIKISEAVLFTK